MRFLLLCIRRGLYFDSRLEITTSLVPKAALTNGALRFSFTMIVLSFEARLVNFVAFMHKSAEKAEAR